MSEKDYSQMSQFEAGQEVDRLVKEKIQAEGWTQADYSRALSIILAENSGLAERYTKDEAMEPRKYQVIVKDRSGTYTSEITREQAMKELDRLSQIKMLEKNLDYSTAFRVVSLERPELHEIYMQW